MNVTTCQKAVLPTFVIIGAQKSATSSLAGMLGLHPQVFMSVPKEPDFFVEDRGWKRGLGWYESLFAAGESATARGEASTSYTFAPHIPGVPERLASVLPNARLIYLMRHPIERMRSAYHHALAGGSERRPIEVALLHDLRYLMPSCYAFQLEAWLPHFEREQILLLVTEDLAVDPVGQLQRVCRFIGVDYEERIATTARENVSAGRRAPRRGWQSYVRLNRRLPRRLAEAVVDAKHAGHPLITRPIDPTELTIQPDVRQQLTMLLRPDLARLEQIAGGDFNAWGMLR